MHDIRFIRKHPEKFTEAMQRRSVTVTADEILQIDRQRRGRAFGDQFVKFHQRSLSPNGVALPR